MQIADIKTNSKILIKNCIVRSVSILASNVS